ncbi:hypothetical protein C8R43DRAFT_944340 [Mycena crocata]|nr:hypothetical protein C8R43DRAFT_944340 [Mycena crocata]
MNTYFVRKYRRLTSGRVGHELNPMNRRRQGCGAARACTAAGGWMWETELAAVDESENSQKMAKRMHWGTPGRRAGAESSSTKSVASASQRNQLPREHQKEYFAMHGFTCKVNRAYSDWLGGRDPDKLPRQPESNNHRPGDPREEPANIGQAQHSHPAAPPPSQWRDNAATYLHMAHDPREPDQERFQRRCIASTSN